MEIRATIGALEFVLRGWTMLPLGSLPVRWLLICDGDEVQAMDLDRGRVLVVDHRSRQDGLARVEVWAPVQVHEGEALALLVLSDPALPKEVH